MVYFVSPYASKVILMYFLHLRNNLMEYKILQVCSHHHSISFDHLLSQERRLKPICILFLNRFARGQGQLSGCIWGSLSSQYEKFAPVCLGMIFFSSVLLVYFESFSCLFIWSLLLYQPVLNCRKHNPKV